MKTLIDWAIKCGNDGDICFTNESLPINGNENISTICSKNETGNETHTSPLFRNENSVEMNKDITTNQKIKLGGNEPVLHTKYGTASVNANSGYYTIVSSKEGNFNKLLHRLIFEEFYNIKIPKNYVIHHKNNQKLDNCILNLQLMSFKEHLLHHYEKGDFTNKDINYCIKESKAQNTTGYFRVSKSKCSQCKQGFIYRYQYYDKGEKQSLWATTIEKLEKKVKDKGLEWRKIQ